MLAAVVGIVIWFVGSPGETAPPNDGASARADSAVDGPRVVTTDVSGAPTERSGSDPAAGELPTLPEALPSSFDGLVAANLGPAPADLQAAAQQLAETQHRAFATRVRDASPDSIAMSLAWQDDAYMMRLTELATKALAERRGLLVVDGIMPDATVGRRHFYLVPNLDNRFGRAIGVLVDLDVPDEQLEAADSACRELRYDLIASKAQIFNARPGGERRDVVRKYIEAQAQHASVDWSWFGLSAGEERLVMVDEIAALLSMTPR